MRSIRFKAFHVWLVGLAILGAACTSTASSSHPSPEDQVLSGLRENAPRLANRVQEVSVDSEDEKRLVVQSSLTAATASSLDSQALCEAARATKVLPRIRVTAGDDTSLWDCDETSSKASSHLQGLIEQEEKRHQEEQRQAQEQRRQEEQRQLEQKRRPAECGSDSYRNVDGACVPRPGSNPNGATAQCEDGSYSYSQNRRGTCSGHGGVAHWL